MIAVEACSPQQSSRTGVLAAEGSTEHARQMWERAGLLGTAAGLLPPRSYRAGERPVFDCGHMTHSANFLAVPTTTH